MKKIGAITIGQSPRDDVIPEIQEILGDGVEILQAGVLDDLTEKEIKMLAPAGNGASEILSLRGSGTVLVSRLRDGRWVHLAEEKIIPYVQEKINLLETSGVSMILLLCTGEFPEIFEHQVPVLLPQKLLLGVVPQLASRIGVVSPRDCQMAGSRTRWGAAVQQVTVAHANPYEGAPGLEEAASRFVQDGVEVCVLDCMGYTSEMKRRLERSTGRPVVLPRTLMARVVSELLN